MKLFIATVLGILAAGLGIWVLELLGHMLFPIPFEIQVDDIEAFKAAMYKIPFTSLMAVVLAHGVGVWIGMFVARMVDKTSHAPMYGVSSFIMLFTVINLLMIPHPTWFTIADIGIIIFATITYVATRKKKA